MVVLTTSKTHQISSILANSMIFTRANKRPTQAAKAHSTRSRTIPRIFTLLGPASATVLSQTTGRRQLSRVGSMCRCACMLIAVAKISFLLAKRAGILTFGPLTSPAWTSITFMACVSTASELSEQNTRMATLSSLGQVLLQCCSTRPAG